MELYIREQDEVKVIVADRKTGYAIAEFYWQAGADQKPLYDALALANEFIYTMRQTGRKKGWE